MGVFDQENGHFRLPRNPYIIKGIADILCVFQGGKIGAIEVKVPIRRKNLTDYQKNFLHEIIRNGGIAFVATSVEDVEAKLSELNIT